MATAGPSTKSYAEAAKTHRPPHAEVLKASRPRYAAVQKAYSQSPPVLRSPASQNDREDGWTDVSSMTSCSWPSALDETSSHGDKAEHPVISKWSREPQDPPYDPYDWFEEDRDTRAQDALATEMNSTARSKRLYNRIGSTWCPGQDFVPLHQFPSYRNDVRRAAVWSVKMTPIKLKHLKRRTMKYDIKTAAAS